MAGEKFNLQVKRSYNTTDPLTAYDANGNIKAMTQTGLKINTSSEIDNLAYTYNTNSNKLLKVTDAISADNKLGDFYNGSSGTGNDYTYDTNGNLTKDNNKNISSITYNFLNLPSVITVTGKGTITYTYDAAGNKLKKVTVDNTVAPSKTTTTLYIGGAVYENDVLQFIAHEEGRIRPIRDENNNITSFTYDYFLKDHLGNVRMVLTEEQKTDAYPPASMETAQATTEESLYANLPQTRVSKPSGYPTDNYTNPNNNVAKTNGNGNKIGPSIILKVMAGDKFNLRVSSWYKKNGATPGSPNSITTDLIAGLIGSLTGAGGPLHGSITSAQLTSSGVISTSASSFLSTQPAPGATKPKAYLNWVFLDEQFKFAGGSAAQVGEDNILYTITKDATVLNAPKNGYLYVFVSNETPNIDVYWDNLQVTHVRGPIMEETHYYPFGLVMSGISSKAAAVGNPSNKFKYNGKEEQRQEFSDGSGLEWLDYGARMYDNQIGRFFTQDPLGESMPLTTSYNYGANNPIRYIDLFGLAPIKGEGEAYTTTYVDKRGRVLDVVNDGKTDVIQFSDIDYNNWDRNNNSQLPTRKGGKLIGHTLYWYDFMKLDEMTGELDRPMYGEYINNPLSFSLNALQRVFQHDGLITNNSFPSGLALINLLNRDWVSTMRWYWAYVYALYQLSQVSGNENPYDIKATLLDGSKGYVFAYDGNNLPIFTTGRAIGNILFGKNMGSAASLSWNASKADVWSAAMEAVGPYNERNGSRMKDRTYNGEHPYSGSYIWFGYWNTLRPSY